MNKDLKIAAGVIAAIILVAVLENSPSQNVSSNVYLGDSSYSSADKPVSNSSASSSSGKSCYHNGIELKGKVQFVDSFPDLKVKFVSSFPDINVQFVSSFPDDCGEWQEVSSFPDFTIQEVDSFPDIEVKRVTSFPGMN